MNDNSSLRPMLKMTVVITDRSRGKKLTEIYREEHVEIFFMFHAVGSANSDILDLLGLGGSDKVVAICVEPDFKARALIQTVVKQLEFNKPGKGIAFSISLSGVCSPINNLFGEQMMKYRERWETEMQNMDHHAEKIAASATHDLIVAVINEGFSGDLMEVAKAAGARGGTIIHARRIGEGDIVKFFGIPIQEEKEIVTILAPREQKRTIMQAIMKDCGMTTEMKGIVFSMHADDVAGIQTAEAEE